MALRNFFTTRFFQTHILLILSLLFYVGNVSALSSVMSPGSTAIISIDPVLPKQGVSFTVNVNGQWRNSCIPSQNDLTFDIDRYRDLDRREVRVVIRLKTTLDQSNACGDEFNPTDYHLSVRVKGIDWNVVGDWSATKVALEITRDPENSSDYIYWERIFDLVLGSHEISPRLGSGYWISEDLPYQSLVIQQQSNTVVFYELTYNRSSGEPNWIYADGQFSGNSISGVSYLINWLSPVEGATQEWGHVPGRSPLVITSYNTLVQPESEDLAFSPSSAGLSVRGINRLRAFVGLHDLKGELQPVYHDYKRWIFATNDVELPAMVPDMIGDWNLYGFKEQKLKQSHQIKFTAGTKVGDDLYRFKSLGGKWVLDCQINLNGEGDCTLVNEGRGLSMNYYLDKTPYSPSLEFFNGNFAKAPLINSKSIVPEQTGILIRSGVRLPVLDLEQ